MIILSLKLSSEHIRSQRENNRVNRTKVRREPLRAKRTEIKLINIAKASNLLNGHNVIYRYQEFDFDADPDRACFLLFFYFLSFAEEEAERELEVDLFL